MKDLLLRIRPTVLIIAALLAIVCLADIWADGDPTVGLAAAGALAAIARDVVEAQ